MTEITRTKSLDGGTAVAAGVCPIVMACDESYAMPLATALRSAAEHNSSGARLEVYVLTSEFSPAGKARVAESLPPGAVTIHWVPVELDSFQNFTTRNYISKMTYARFLMPDLIPRELTRVLYLDADILVLQDLGALSALDMEGFACAGVTDTDAVPHAERLGLYADGGKGLLCDYFNAGVLLVDLATWRKERISEKAIDFMQRNPETLLADQDALNVACGGRWLKLDARWNFQEHYEAGYARISPQQRPPVAHFAGKWKPWNPKSASVDADFYDAYRSRTRYGRSPEQKFREGLQYSWWSLKAFLRQFKAVASLRSYRNRHSS